MTQSNVFVSFLLVLGLLWVFLGNIQGTVKKIPSPPGFLAITRDPGP